MGDIGSLVGVGHVMAVRPCVHGLTVADACCKIQTIPVECHAAKDDERDCLEVRRRRRVASLGSNPEPRPLCEKVLSPTVVRQPTCGKVFPSVMEGMPMPKLNATHELAQPTLFESWENLPMEVRHRVTRLFLSVAALIKSPQSPQILSTTAAMFGGFAAFPLYSRG